MLNARTLHPLRSLCIRYSTLSSHKQAISTPPRHVASYSYSETTGQLQSFSPGSPLLRPVQELIGHNMSHLGTSVNEHQVDALNNILAACLEHKAPSSWVNADIVCTIDALISIFAMRGEVVVSVTKGKLYMTCKYPNHNEDLFVPRIARGFRRLAREPTTSVLMTVLSRRLGGLNILTADEISCVHSAHKKSCPPDFALLTGIDHANTRRGSHGWERLHLRAHLLGVERLFLASCKATNLEVVAVNEVATGSSNPNFPQSGTLASSVEYGFSTLRRIRDFCLKEHHRQMMMANRRVSTEYRVLTNARDELQIMHLQCKRLAEVLPPGRPIRRHGLVLAKLHDELQERVML